MKKLALALETLEVQSFVTEAVRPARGTVAAHDRDTLLAAEPVLAADTGFCSADWSCDCTEQPSCGVWCPPTQDQSPTGPCAC